MRGPTRATLTNPNFQSFSGLGKSLKYSLRPILKNTNFESKDEQRKAKSQFEFKFELSLTKVLSSYENIIVLGDFNIDIKRKGVDSSNLSDFCDLFH